MAGRIAAMGARIRSGGSRLKDLLKTGGGKAKSGGSTTLAKFKKGQRSARGKIQRAYRQGKGKTTQIVKRNPLKSIGAAGLVGAGGATYASKKKKKR